MYIGDQITSEGNYGEVEFYSGGRVGFGKGTTIEITGDNTAEDMNPPSWWETLGSSSEKPVHIRESSGVMGIRDDGYASDCPGGEHCAWCNAPLGHEHMTAEQWGARFGD